jgi:hypothetical protein
MHPKPIPRPLLPKCNVFEVSAHDTLPCGLVAIRAERSAANRIPPPPPTNGIPCGEAFVEAIQRRVSILYMIRIHGR